MLDHLWQFDRTFLQRFDPLILYLQILDIKELKLRKFHRAGNLTRYIHYANISMHKAEILKAVKKIIFR